MWRILPDWFSVGKRPWYILDSRVHIVVGCRTVQYLLWELRVSNVTLQMSQMNLSEWFRIHAFTWCSHFHAICLQIFTYKVDTFCHRFDGFDQNPSVLCESLSLSVPPFTQHYAEHSTMHVHWPWWRASS